MQPVVRALKILTTLSGGRGMALGDIADELDLPASTVHRFMTVLEEERFVVRTVKGKRYHLGPAARGLMAGTKTAYLREVAEPVMRRLVREHGETVFLTELVGPEVVCFAFQEGTRSLRHHVQIGRSLPLHAASSARMILAGLPDDEIGELISKNDYVRFTARTITDPESLRRHLSVTRAAGYDICDDEMEDHIWAVSVPLLDAQGPTRCALTLVAPLVTVEAHERRAELIDAARRAGAEISSEQGRLVGSA